MKRDRHAANTPPTGAHNEANKLRFAPCAYNVLTPIREKIPKTLREVPFWVSECLIPHKILAQADAPLRFLGPCLHFPRPADFGVSVRTLAPGRVHRLAATSLAGCAADSGRCAVFLDRPTGRVHDVPVRAQTRAGASTYTRGSR